MLESHLFSGKQSPHPACHPAISVTDSCLDWAATENLLLTADRLLTPVVKTLSYS
jgi:phospho-2-dehydro-3-deoxyheptonate aldolase